MTGSSVPWWWWVSALVVVPLSVWGLWFALLGDRAKGRRRCPKCRYDLAGTGVASRASPVMCPECGRAVRSERALRRGKKRWGLATVAVVVIVAVPVSWRGLSTGWWSLVPTTGLFLADRVVAGWVKAHGPLPAGALRSGHAALHDEIYERDAASLRGWRTGFWLDNHPYLRPTLLSLTDLSDEMRVSLGLDPGYDYVWWWHHDRPLQPQIPIRYIPSLGEIEPDLSTPEIDSAYREAGLPRYRVSWVFANSEPEQAARLVLCSDSPSELVDHLGMGDGTDLQWCVVGSGGQQGDAEQTVFAFGDVPLFARTFWVHRPDPTDLGRLIDPRLGQLRGTVQAYVDDLGNHQVSWKATLGTFVIDLESPTDEELAAARSLSDLMLEILREQEAERSP